MLPLNCRALPSRKSQLLSSRDYGDADGVRSRGDSHFTASDFDSMPYLLAVGRVHLEVVYPLARAEVLTLRTTGNLKGLPDRGWNHACTQRG